MSAGDDASVGFVHDMDGVLKMALSGEFLEHRPARRGRQGQGHELETPVVVPAAQTPDGLAAEAAIGVEENSQGSRWVGLAFAVESLLRQGIGCRGAEW